MNDPFGNRKQKSRHKQVSLKNTIKIKYKNNNKGR